MERRYRPEACPLYIFQQRERYDIKTAEKSFTLKKLSVPHCAPLNNVNDILSK